MTDIKPGWTTSEFRLGSMVSVLTVFGEQLNIFDTSAFADDPVLMLVYRGIQLLALATVAAAYIMGRSEIKKNGQTPAPLILENKPD